MTMADDRDLMDVVDDFMAQLPAAAPRPAPLPPSRVDARVESSSGSSLAGLDAATLCDHLERLHALIAEGCRTGLHRHLARVPAEFVRSILRSAGPDVDADTTMATCRRAGQAATLAALVDEYRDRLRALKALDPDAAFRHAAALELCLCQPVEGRP